MHSSSPIVLAFVGLVLAAFWYDATIATASAASSQSSQATAHVAGAH
jgi:hypothetical protein